MVKKYCNRIIGFYKEVEERETACGNCLLNMRAFSIIKSSMSLMHVM